MYVPVSGKKRATSGYKPVSKKKKQGIDWDRLQLQSNVDAFPSGVAQSTAPVWKPGMPSTGEALQTPDVVSGLATSLPARGVAFAAKLPQPKIETFTEQAQSIFPEEKLGKAGTALGFTAAMIGDPLNLIGGGGAKATKLAKLLAKTEDVNEVTKLLRGAGFSDDLVAWRAPTFVTEKDAAKIERALVRDIETMKYDKAIKELSNEERRLFEEARDDYYKQHSQIQEEANTLFKQVKRDKRGNPIKDPILDKKIKDLSPRLKALKAPRPEDFKGATPKKLETEIGVVEEWGTRNQYRAASPFDMNSPQGQRWEMEQVLKGKPAYLNGDPAMGALNEKEVMDFADKHNLYTTTTAEGEMVVAKDEAAAKRLIKALEEGNHREVGLALGYQDLRMAKATKQLPIPEGLPKLPKAPSPKKLLGEAPAARITRTAKESTLLKEKIKHQATGARAGLKEGEFLGRQKGFREGMDEAGKVIKKKEVQLSKAEAIIKKRDNVIEVLKNTAQSSQRAKDLIVDYVKDALSPAKRGKAMTLVRDAKNAKDLTKAFTRIHHWAEEEIRNGLKTDILKLQKKVLESPSVAVDYKARVEELLGDFDLNTKRESTLEQLKKTQEFLQAEKAKGNDIEMPRRVLNALQLLARTPFSEMTMNQLKGLHAEMQLLEDLGRTKFRTQEALWESEKAYVLKEVEKQGAKPLNDIELLRPEIGERLTITQKFKNFLWSAANRAARIDRVITPMDAVFDLLDGGKGTYNGANFRLFKARVDASYGRYISRKDALQNPVVELATKNGLSDTNFERMGVVAAREQDGGMEKLLDTGYTKEQVDAVTLTKEEQEVLDLMRSTFDSQFPEIKDTMRRLYNKPVEKVKNYFSFMTDFKAMDDSEVFERFGSQTPMHKKKNVEVGFTKSRTGGEQAIKINALDVFLAHTDNTSYLLEMGETSKMLGEIAAKQEYGDAVGAAGQLLVREWVDVIARKGGADGASHIALLDALRRNVGAGFLGLKLSTVAIQPTSLIDGAGFIGPKYASKGVSNFLTSPEWREFVVNMPEIKDRLGGEFALRELTDKNWLQEAQRKGFIPMQTMDRWTAGMVAAGAYERKMAELGRAIDFSKVDPEALAYAQLAVRRTQSSGAFKDVPLAVSRGALTGNRSVDRAFLQFQNFLLTRWSRIRHDAIRAGINEKDFKKVFLIFTAVITASLAVAGIRLGVNRLQDLVTGREDEDSPTEDVIKSFGYELSGNVPFVGNVLGMALYDGEMFPILDAPMGVVSGLTRAITSKSEGAKLRGLTEFAGSTGALFGVPGSAQVETLARGALQDEKAPPRTKKMKTPPGLPELPSLKSRLPSLRPLPKL